MPERWYPGRFDYFGASHQIFHVCVVLAALAHFMVSDLPKNSNTTDPTDL